MNYRKTILALSTLLHNVESAPIQLLDWNSEIYGQAGLSRTEIIDAVNAYKQSQHEEHIRSIRANLHSVVGAALCYGALTGEEIHAILDRPQI